MKTSQEIQKQIQELDQLIWHCQTHEELEDVSGQLAKLEQEYQEATDREKAAVRPV